MRQKVVGSGAGKAEFAGGASKAAADVFALAAKPDAKFGRAVEDLLKEVNGRTDACAYLSGVLKELPSDKARIKFCSRTLIGAQDTAVQSLVGRWLFEHGADEKLRRLQVHYPVRVNRSLQKIAEVVDLELDIYKGRERAVRVSHLGRLKNLGIPVSAVDDGYCSARLLCLKQGIDAAIERIEKGTSVQLDILSHAVVGVLLNGTRKDITELRQILAAPTDESETRQRIVSELISDACVILQGQIEEIEGQKGLAEERNAYHGALKLVTEIQKGRSNSYRTSLKKPKSPPPLEQLEVLVASEPAEVHRHIGKIGDLCIQLGAAADDQLRTLIHKIAPISESSKLLSLLLRQIRESASVARVSMIAELAAQHDVVRPVARDEFVALCCECTTINPVPVEVRRAARGAFWTLGDFAPLFKGPPRSGLVRLFRPEGAGDSGLFLSREEIGKFAQEVVLNHSDRNEALKVLSSFRWHKVLSLPERGQKYTKVEPEFATLLAQFTEQEINDLSLEHQDSFVNLLDVLRFHSLEAGRADRLMVKICAAVGNSQERAQVLAAAAPNFGISRRVQIANALVDGGYYGCAAVVGVLMVAAAEEAKADRLRNLGEELDREDGAASVVVDMWGPNAKPTPLEVAGYDVLRLVPPTCRRMAYDFAIALLRKSQGVSVPINMIQVQKPLKFLLEPSHGDGDTFSVPAP